MKAAIAESAGPAEVLVIREVPDPEVRPGWALVAVRGFGLNRSELMTRQGHSPNVRFPRVLGIECVGILVDPSDSGLPVGTTVAAVMGEMGREFDGGYAEYALLPTELLIPLDTDLTWEVLAALPETYLTAHGSLAALGAGEGGSLLVRGGSSSVGMAALSLARGRGVTTTATTRNPAKADALTAAGADRVVIDRGDVADQLAGTRPDGVLDLIGAPTVLDSLRLAASGGTVCVAGMLSGSWVVPAFEPVAHIPSGTRLTAFHSGDVAGAAGRAALQEVVDGVAAGRYRANVDRVFALDDIVAAHRHMETDAATGKIVVLTGT